jgi:hypothetical protein
LWLLLGLLVGLQVLLGVLELLRCVLGLLGLLSLGIPLGLSTLDL